MNSRSLIGANAPLLNWSWARHSPWRSGPAVLFAARPSAANRTIGTSNPRQVMRIGRPPNRSSDLGVSGDLASGGSFGKQGGRACAQSFASIFYRMVEYRSSTRAKAGRLNRVYGAIADPTRRAILQRLAGGEASVGALADDFPISFNG